MWTVVDTAQETLFGHAGLRHLENTNEVEIGDCLGRLAWGQRIATEPGAACLKYGIETLGLEQMVAVVHLQR